MTCPKVIAGVRLKLVMALSSHDRTRELRIKQSAERQHLAEVVQWSALSYEAERRDALALQELRLEEEEKWERYRRDLMADTSPTAVVATVTRSLTAVYRNESTMSTATGSQYAI